MTRCFGVVMLLCASACTHAITVRSEAPNTQLIVAGEDLGLVPGEGAKAEVPLGAGPVPYEVHGADGGVALGEIPRTRPVWWVLALAGAGCACCAPSAASVGFLLANPGLFSAPLLILVTGDVGLFTRAFSYPGWFTVPLVTGCGTAGMAPLAGVFFAEMPEDDVTLPAPAPRGAPVAPVPAHAAEPTQPQVNY